MRPWRPALLVPLLAAVVCTPAGAVDPPGMPPLCGVNGQVDQLLGCPGVPPAAVPTGGTAAAAGVPPGTLEASAGERPAMGTFSAVRYDPRRLIVRFERRARPSAIAAALRDARVTVERRIPALHLYGVSVDPSRREGALRSLEADPAVASAEPEVIVGGADTNPNDAIWSEQNGLRAIGLPRAWDLSRGSEQVIVAVVDTGVDPAHPDLTGKVLPGRDFANGDADASDDHGHGTAVAGVIAARADNHEGIAGVCWLCRVLPVKVLGADGTAVTTTVAAGVVWAADQHARVINLSLGGPGVDGALDDVVAYARSKGAVVVAAAGNNGSTTPFFPAASPGAIGVAGTDTADRFYSWSNHGQWVAVSAPGCNLTTVRGGYAVFCGTSAASPVVAGLAALAIARNPLAGPEEIERAIVSSAVPSGLDVRYGRVDAPRALELVPPAAPVAPVATATFAGSLTRRSPVRVFRRSAGEGALSATLRWTGSVPLTLELVAGDGSVLARTAGRSPVRLSQTVAQGRYTLRISARPTARVSFTLAVANAGLS